jgi:hypothetical protein
MERNRRRGWRPDKNGFVRIVDGIEYRFLYESSAL